MATVMDQDDHGVHMAEHNKLLLDPNFMLLDAKTQSFIQKHVDVHQKKMQQIQDNMRQQALEDLSRTRNDRPELAVRHRRASRRGGPPD